MFADLLDLIAFLWISVQDTPNQVLSFLRDELGHLKLSIEYLFVEQGSVWIFKRKETTD